MTLRNLPGLKTFAAPALIGRTLSIADCQALESIIGHLKIREDLNLNGCSSLSKGLEVLNVPRNLSLVNCGNLREYPKVLQVGGNLDVTGATSLPLLPDDAVVRGRLIRRDGPRPLAANDWKRQLYFVMQDGLSLLGLNRD